MLLPVVSIAAQSIPSPDPHHTLWISVTPCVVAFSTWSDRESPRRCRFGKFARHVFIAFGDIPRYIRRRYIKESYPPQGVVELLQVSDATHGFPAPDLQAVLSELPERLAVSLVHTVAQKARPAILNRKPTTLRRTRTSYADRCT